MGLVKQECYLLTCDECGEPMQGFEDDFIVHQDEPDDFKEWMADLQWSIIDDRYLCRNCCPTCGCGHAREEHYSKGGAEPCYGKIRGECSCENYQPVPTLVLPISEPL